MCWSLIKFNPRYLMDPSDRFIVSGPLYTIPQTRVKWGGNMNLRRCDLCKYIYGRTILSTWCKHITCTYCLGVTGLVSVDHFLCMKCGVIPDQVFTSWEHQAGEIRLHIEGQEVVEYPDILVHIADRWRKLWLTSLPFVSTEEYYRRDKEWRIRHSNQMLKGGLGYPLMPKSDTVPAPAREY